MKNKGELIKKLQELEADDRLKEKPALVQINAPLALIQVEPESKISTLRWVLGEDVPPEPKKNGKHK